VQAVAIVRPALLGLALGVSCTSGPDPDAEPTSMSTTVLDPGTTVGLPVSSDSGTTVTPEQSTGTTIGVTVADSTITTDGGPVFDVGGADMPRPEPLPAPQLWYSVEDLLVYIELDPADGALAQLVTSTITNDPPLLSNVPGVVEFNAMTMLADGSLLGARGLAGQTQLYYVAAPPTVATVSAGVASVMVWAAHRMNSSHYKACVYD
jgi:hypothetical protein